MQLNKGIFSSSFVLLRFRPFVSSDLDDYLRRYWAVVFCIASRPTETAQMRQYLCWYCTRAKFVELDHHSYSGHIRDTIIERTGCNDLPVLFVNKKFVGTLAEMQRLESDRLLKDVLQFGFKWKTMGKSGDQLRLETLPSAFQDASLFRARYRGTPVAKPVVQLPSYHPLQAPDV